MYELRTNNQPDAMPQGDNTLSRHRTLAAARAAAAREHRAWRQSDYYSPGSYLPRLIVNTRTGAIHAARRS